MNLDPVTPAPAAKKPTARDALDAVYAAIVRIAGQLPDVEPIHGAELSALAELSSTLHFQAVREPVTP